MTLLTLGPEDRDRTVPVLPGDRILLRLPENPTTGHRWQGTTPGVLRLLRDTNEPGTAPGEAGRRVFEWEVQRAGDAEIALTCGQAWEPDSQPSGTFRIVLRGGQKEEAG